MTVTIPRFLLVPDATNNQVFILCTATMSLILVTHHTPAQLLLVRGQQDAQVLLDAAEFWKQQLATNQN